MFSTAGAEQSVRRHFRVFIAIAAMLSSVVAVDWASTTADAATQRIDLRVLVLDDGTPWIAAIAGELEVEGVPFTTVQLGQPDRPSVTDTFLSTTDHANFQAVVAPSADSALLTSAEWQSIHAFEATFSIREVDAYNWPSAAVGLSFPSYLGSMDAMVGTASAVARQSGFQYLDGPVPFGVGSYGYLAAPLTATSVPALAPGDTFTTFLGITAPDGTATSAMGVYTHDGLEQMVITTSFAFTQLQFKTVGHGLVTWMTRGVHLGYQRNYLTFHVDDAFSEDALWDSVHHCTPGEDCPRDANGVSLYPESTVRMTADDVTYAVAWQRAQQYTLTLAFNGRGIAAGDPLTTAFQSNASAFRWLNHGLSHIFQGCVQDFTVVPWVCATDTAGEVQWTPQATIAAEITDNIVAGRSIGLPFDATEYLSGEHSGLRQAPQQMVDNPNFGAALAATGVRTIGADASRESAGRSVGTALTVPRHPTALYYNTSTAAAAVDEYNWLYTSRVDGGGGYCDDNPATATCIAPLDPATGFAGYIVPTDAAYDLGFVLSNDPRPFYAHTSNLTGDRLLYPLLDTMLFGYRATHATNAPVVNLTLTQAATALQRQATWASDRDVVTAYTDGNLVTIVNPTGHPVPVTLPTNSSVAGAQLQSYGGELSAWLTGSTLAATLPTTQLSLGGSTTFVEGRAGLLTVRSSTANATIEINGELPAGLVWARTGTGSYSLSGVAATGSAGNYPVTVTATSAAGTASRDLVVLVARRAVITSASSDWFLSGVPYTFTATATGSPTPVVRITGTLPRGFTTVSNADGTATVSGITTFTTSNSYRLTVTATNAAGSVSQTLTLRGATPPVFTSTATRTVRVARATSFTVSTSATPRAALAVLDPLPTGLTFRDRGDGSGVVSGTPAVTTLGIWKVRIAATNIAGGATQTLTISVVP